MPHTRLPKATPGDGPGTSDAGTVRQFRAAPGPKRRSRKCGRPFGTNAPAAPVREKLPPFDERIFFRRPLLRRRWGAEGSGLRTGQMPCRSLPPQTPPKSRQSRPGPGPHVQTFLPQTCALPGFFFHTPAIGASPGCRSESARGAMLLPALPLRRAVSRPLPEPVPRFQNRRPLRLSGMRVFIALSAGGFPRRSSLVGFLPYVSFAGSRSPQEEDDPQNPHIE